MKLIRDVENEFGDKEKWTPSHL